MNPMARLHTRRHGKSRSRKTFGSEANAGVDKEALEQAIIAYSKQEMKPSVIGERVKNELSANYLKEALGKRLTEYLEEKGVRSDIPYDLLDLMAKAVSMRKHLALNNRDVHNKTRLQRVESKIWRLSKYYKRTGKLPMDWKYDPVQAELRIRGR